MAGRYVHHLACGADVTITLDADRRRCTHGARPCPNVEMLARALAGTLGDADRNGHEARAAAVDDDDGRE